MRLEEGEASCTGGHLVLGTCSLRGKIIIIMIIKKKKIKHK